MAVALWLLAALLIGCRPAVALTTETCDASQRAYTLAADASVYIGVILGLHGSSSGGPGRHGCGAALDGMQTYEALRWAVARINQDSGVINGRAIVDSYVPGVKIGKHRSKNRGTLCTRAGLRVEMKSICQFSSYFFMISSRNRHYKFSKIALSFIFPNYNAIT